MTQAKMIVLLFIAALILRVSFICVYDNHKFLTQGFFADDTEMYDTVAKNVMAGKGFELNPRQHARIAPLYPLFLAGFFSLFGHDVVIVRMAQALIGAANCLIVYLIAKELFDVRAAAVAGILSVLYYPFVQMPAYLMTEELFNFLLLSALWMIVRQISNPDILPAFFAGIFIGLAQLCKGVAFNAIPLLAAGLFFAVKDKGRKIKCVVVFAAAAFLLIIPWMIRNYRIYKAVIPCVIVSGDMLYKGNSPGATGGIGGMYTRGVDFVEPVDMPAGLGEYEKDRFRRDRAVDFIRKNPLAAVELAAVKFWNMWRPYHAGSRLISKVVMCVSYIPIVLFAIAGLIMSMKEWRRFLVFYLIIAYYVAAHMALIGLIRYRYPIEPLLIVFCAYAAVTFYDAVRNNDLRAGAAG